MRIILFVILVLVAALILFIPRGAAAEGRVAFADHCATCHGVGAKGDGPMAAVLSVPPPDLTALSRTNGGVFPLERVLRRVDGQEDVLSHGGPMPVFGILLDGPSVAVLAPDGSEVVTSEALAGIVGWLEEIQK